jgi:uncharacterized membrane protein YqjE
MAEAAANLSHSLSRLAATTAEYVRTRVDQADDALANEGRRQLWILLSAGALLFSLVLATVFAGVAIVMAYRDSNPVLAAVAVAAAFLALAATAVWVLLVKLRQRPSALQWIVEIAALVAGFRRPTR